MIHDMKLSEDRSNDFLTARENPLHYFFNPASVAVIGATEKEASVGRTLVNNLKSSNFSGKIFPVNPKRPEILGLKAFPKLLEVPEPVDLAVIVTPASSVPALVADCVKKGVKAAIIISAGFREVGPEGAALEAEIRKSLSASRLRIIGPNCLGVMNPGSGLNATFAHGIARPGQVALISQSGALITAVLDWSLQENVGFSSIVSLGSMLDVSWADMIDYFGNDPKTESIALYMETIGDAHAFLSAARQVALAKPIIVIKAGRSSAAAKAAASHTGSLAGSHDVLEAAFRRCGVLSVNHISDLFYSTDFLAKQPRPKGKRLCIITNAGGPGVLATDALVEGGGQLAELDPNIKTELSTFLPAAWSHANPVDVLGDAEPSRYAKAVACMAKDPGNDGILVILTPQDMTDPELSAKELSPYAGLGDRPIFASWMGGADVLKGREVLSQSKIPNFQFPDTACRIFNTMSSYAANLEALYQTPESFDSSFKPDTAAVEKILGEARKAGRSLLSEYESKEVLRAYGIPCVPTELALSPDEAAKKAQGLQFPVVLKLNSLTITHKSDVGGVKLNLQDEAEVRRAFEEIKSSVSRLKGAEHFQGVTVQSMVKAEGYEIILGSSLDPQVGPVLLFGSGGQLVEVFKDRALALPPLNSTLARLMMERTKIYEALKGVRGRDAVDLAALEALLVKFSRLVSENLLIKELDINPLLASPEGLLALDARVLLHGPEIEVSALPRPAIRPYPSEYVKAWTSKEGAALTLRPIRPEDEKLLIRFHEGLSDQSVYKRYLENMRLSERTAHERLIRICCVDYDRDVVLVAEHKGAAGSEIAGIARLERLSFGNEAELSLLVGDAWQKHGLGTALLEELLEAGKDEGMSRALAYILPSNSGMRSLCKKLGFEESGNESEGFVVAAKSL